MSTITSDIETTKRQPGSKTSHLVERRNKEKSDTRKEQGDATDNLWEIRIYNDQINTHEWVAKCLVIITGASEWLAYQTTNQAHQEGEALLGLFEREVAELFTSRLLKEGIVVRMFPVNDFQ